MIMAHVTYLDCGALRLWRMWRKRWCMWYITIVAHCDYGACGVIGGACGALQLCRIVIVAQYDCGACDTFRLWCIVIVAHYDCGELRLWRMWRV